MDNLISGFDILVTYGIPATATSYLIGGPGNWMLAAGGVQLFDFIDFSDISTSGQANLVFTSLFSDAELFAKQCPGGTCGPIVLARLFFGELDIDRVALSFDWSAPHVISCEALNPTAPKDQQLARQCYPVTATPEPGTLALLGLGILGMAVGRRRRES